MPHEEDKAPKTPAKDVGVSSLLRGLRAEQSEAPLSKEPPWGMPSPGEVVAENGQRVVLDVGAKPLDGDVLRGPAALTERIPAHGPLQLVDLRRAAIEP